MTVPSKTQVRRDALRKADAPAPQDVTDGDADEQPVRANHDLPARGGRGDRDEAPGGTADVDELPEMQLAVQLLPRWHQVFSGLFQLIAFGLILFGGVLAYQEIVNSAPTAERGNRGRVARLVDVAPVQPAETGPVIEAWGEVVPSQTLVVRPEIAGTITWVHPEITPGGRIEAGATVALFDTSDLKLALSRAETEIASIDARILLERGQAAIGKRELSRLSRNITDEQRALVLREPQMKQLEAERAAAVATRDQATNALARAEVKVPFDAVVLSEQVAPGSMLAQGAEAATLVASDKFHVMLAVPTSTLSWLRFDGAQRVEVSQDGVWPAGSVRDGKITRLNTQLSETGRMAEVIVEVDDPLARGPETGAPQLLLGSFVKGTVTLPALPGSVLLDRAHVRDNDTVWVMNAEDKLEIRSIQIAWRGPDHVLVVDGLAEGERVVTTTLATHAPGMSLRTREGVSG